jgi:CubicO group peptidase (beta-lactamase class C family)
MPIPGAYPIPEKLQTLYDQAGIEDPNDDLAAWIARIAALPLHAQPGAAWRYGCGLDVLARVIEVVAGMPFAEFLRQRIFEPLGMPDSDFFAPPEKAARLVRAYQPDGKDEWEDLGEEERASYLKPPRIATGSGNLVSTAADYTHFSQMLANGGQLEGARILSRKTIQFMAANRLRPDQLPFRPFADTSMAGYGFGLGVRTLLDPAQLGIPASLGEFGWSGWFGTGVWIDPVERLSGVLMTQVAPPVAFWPDIPPLEIRKIVYQAIDD